MAVYHQMGHDSWNLIDEKSLHGYSGIVLSPVNDPPENVVTRLSKLGKRRDKLEIILDPQFYKPSSDRGHLASWSHFSDDVDTVNLGDISWWEKRCNSLVATARDIGANAICSPAMLPRVYDDDYYRWTVDCAQRLQDAAAAQGLDTLLTAIVRLQELAKKGTPQRIASILTSNRISRLYLVLYDDLGPREQRTDFEALAGAINLIRLLEDAGTRVLVAFSGLDILLWKAAGASDAATGKFFNLRRFVPGRWEDASEGGRVVPYWTDGLLITWLREDDVKLLDKQGLIDRESTASNPYAQRILEVIDSGMGEAWMALGWRQYLHWFMEVEAAIDHNHSIAHQLLVAADSRWGEVNGSGIYLFDRQNTGDWIRPWLNAIRLGLQTNP
ncbi:MAG: hypothetical protein CVU20_12650 [Betaproteobacteria bacterium HGW-Betaproteobacteria-14]|nr:MAG: hypothetical protein CVU20_12650 [Betaproteobacteria bacterium HGW-Betaproteobacteria-14]